MNRKADLMDENHKVIETYFTAFAVGDRGPLRKPFTREHNIPAGNGAFDPLLAEAK